LAAKTAQKGEKRIAWNKGIEVGQRTPFTAQDVKRIKTALVKQGEDGLRDLALFSTAIDTMLHAVDLLSLTVKDVRKRDRTIRDTLKVPMAGTTSSVECMLSERLPPLSMRLNKEGKVCTGSHIHGVYY
jgi:integrase